MEGGSSSGNVSSDGCDVISLSRSGTTIAVALCYGVLIPLIVLGNGLVVTSFLINHKLRTATNIFICGLGLSDLLIGLFSVPYWTYISSLESIMDVYCTSSLYIVYICIDIWTGCASILQLTAIAIERLYFTVTPLRHRRLSRSIYWYMIGIAWFYSTFMAVLQPLQKEWRKEYSVLLMVTCFLFPLFIIISVYLYILKVGRRQAQKQPSTRRRMGSTGGDFKEFNIFITVIVITGVFVIAWAPFFVVTAVASLCPRCISHPEHDPLVRVVKWMQYSSSAINPYIYAYRNNEVRQTFKKILRLLCFCGCGSRNKPRKGERNSVHLHEIKQSSRKTMDDRFKTQNVHPMNGQARPSMLNIDEIMSHTQSSETSAPRGSRLRELDFAKQNLRSPVLRIYDPKINVGFYDDNGVVGMRSSTREERERHTDVKRNFKEKGIDNEAYLQEPRKESRLERENGFVHHGNKRKPKINQNRPKSRDHITHFDESRKSANQKRVRTSRDTETTRCAGIHHSRTLDDNQTSRRSTKQFRRHRTRDKEMTKDRINTCNDEMSDNTSYV